jgi:hypothetical protein
MDKQQIDIKALKRKILAIKDEYGDSIIPRHEQWRGTGMHGAWRCIDKCARCRFNKLFDDFSKGLNNI